MSVLNQPLVFVDIETNGLSALRGKVIEVAAIRVEKGRISRIVNTLVDPGTELPPFISNLTGITSSDLVSAPSFRDIADELYDVMDGALFVAHNVRFDYSFLKQEYRRLSRSFNPKLLCTVRLSRAMYPAERGHKLQDLIDRCDLRVLARHRAYDDAEAMWQFICHLQQNFPVELIEKALARQIKTPALPKNLSPGLLSSLPEGPGVYIFQDDAQKPLYIGKSVNIKKRVLSHFAGDHSSESEFKITQTVAHIETHPTAGELQALLLESQLVKSLQPLYNRQLRRSQKLTLARRKYDSNGYITLILEDTASIDPDELEDILAVYPTKGKAKSFLIELCKTYGLCPRILGLEKGNGGCFSYQLKKCRGACVGTHLADEHNATLIDALDRSKLQEWPFTSPVIVAENSHESPDYHSIVVDNWCVIADVSQPEDCSPTVKFHERAFDLDTYKILRTFFDTKRHRLSIKPISHRSLQEMASLV